jgi:hypothetical protein
MTHTKDMLDEIYSVKPATARYLSLALLTKLLNSRKEVKSAETTEDKLDALSDMILHASYLDVLSIAIDQNDARLIKKVKPR